MTDNIIVYIVSVSEEEAGVIAKELVKNRLAACVNIFPAINSVYWWDGKVQEGKEVAVFVKSQVHKFEEIKKMVLNIHSYECPCIISLPIQDGEENYLKWITKELR